MKTVSAVVIGAGYHGCSIAAQLAVKGVKTTLFEKKEIGSWASGSNFGCGQLQDSAPGLSFDINSYSFNRIWNLEKELGFNFELRPLGSLILAANKAEMDEIEKLYKEKTSSGLDIEMLEKNEIKRYEPNINSENLLGATYYLQGQVDPFKFMYAFTDMGARSGLEILENTEVKRIIVKDGVCKGIETDRGTEHYADYIIIAAGAWTKQLCGEIGLSVPIEFIKAEAFVTEPLEPYIHTFFSSASFFIEAHGSTEDQGDTNANTSLCGAPSGAGAGNLLLGETSKDWHGDPDSISKLTSIDHCRGISRQMKELFPALANLNILRSWTTASPSTPSLKPVLGFAGPEGLIIAAGFKSSVVIAPAVGEIATDLVTQGRTFCDLSEFTDQAVYDD